MDFAKLDDSPMFREQIQLLEEDAESLREICLKFCKGCRKYTEGLGESYDGDIAFSSSLEVFGGHAGSDSIDFGGPVMTKFAIALREIATYKEVLRSQVEQILNEKLLQFVNLDLFDVKAARKRFDKASLLYDQARERYLSLRKGAKADLTALMEEELYNARTAFAQARFTLVTALSNVEAKRKFEFVEAASRTMEAHLNFFKKGYEFLHQMEPYIRQVLTYAQQSKESSEHEQAVLSEKMKEFKRKIDRENRLPLHGSLNGDGMQVIGRSSNKQIEAAIRTSANGKVQILRQGYLSKRASNIRGDWQRRFFVLDSKGMLYYYRKRQSRPSGSGSNRKRQSLSESNSGLLSRWFSSHYHGGVHDERSVARHTVNLLTSTIKVDADQTDLRFCFRIISPSKTYTLQAENAADQLAWIDNIRSVIASLLSSQSAEQYLPHSHRSRRHRRSASESISFGSQLDHDLSGEEGYSTETSLTTTGNAQHTPGSGQSRLSMSHNNNHIEMLRKVSGNHVCADCGAPEPDWASLNLGILLCIECSGVHRNLGVHISKVRSLTLDVKVWEPSIINLFQSLGNNFANSIWEELLESDNMNCSDPSCSSSNLGERHEVTIQKPVHTDSISVKERFIHAKYAEKLFVGKLNVDPHVPVAKQMWDSVYLNHKKYVYHLIVACATNINTVHESAREDPCCSHALPPQEQVHYPKDQSDSYCTVRDALPRMLTEQPSDEFFDPRKNPEGLPLLHVACLTADIGMVELLLQYGANTNATDVKGQTPIHLCVIQGKSDLVKLLIRRGAEPGVVDNQGKTPLQYALELQSITDGEALFMMEERGKTSLSMQ